MKAVISSTYDNQYMYFIPIVTFLWNKLGVDVICFMPYLSNFGADNRIKLIDGLIIRQKLSLSKQWFNAPLHKQSTYAQCSRLYAACLDLPEDEILVTGDVDMLPFEALKKTIDNTILTYGGIMNVLGVDLVPESQYPMCYAWGSVKEWRKAYKYTYGGGYNDNDYVVKSYQEYLDLILGDIECENMRGNYWSKDQQELKLILSKTAKIEHLRARPNTQFAESRVDRDDINWRAYVNEDLIDAHLWRVGYSDGNFANILELLKIKYPNDNFDWVILYTEQYKKLL